MGIKVGDHLPTWQWQWSPLRSSPLSEASKAAHWGLGFGFPNSSHSKSGTRSLHSLYWASANYASATQPWLVMPCPEYLGQSLAGYPSTEWAGCHQHMGKNPTQTSQQSGQGGSYRCWTTLRNSPPAEHCIQTCVAGTILLRMPPSVLGCGERRRAIVVRAPESPHWWGHESTGLVRPRSNISANLPLSRCC